MGGATVSYWLSEKWSIDFTARTMVNFVKERGSPEDSYIASFLFGGKRYFPNLRRRSPVIRPFLTAAVGPYLRRAKALDGTAIKHRAAGGNLGAGFDIQLARWCMVGIKAGYNFTADFTDDFTGTFGKKTSYRGFELGIDFSFLLGKGRTPGS